MWDDPKSLEEKQYPYSSRLREKAEAAGSKHAAGETRMFRPARSLRKMVMLCLDSF